MRTHALLSLSIGSLLVASACRRSSAPEAAPAPAPAAASANFASGEAVIAAMRERYDGKWYKTLTFKQKTSRLVRDTTWRVDIWYEASHVPGRLRIDFDPISDGSGVLYARDSTFSFTKGKALPGQPGLNDLLILGFDVYANTPARTASLLRKQGFDLTRVHTATFDNRPMIVVGARAGETRRKQFWVDAEHLYFVRMIEPTVRDSTKTQDVRFVNYRKVGSAWIAARVEVYDTNGKLVFHEDYSDIKTDLALDEALFDPAKWKTAKHWMNP
ncbi:MAG: hypothetical protein V4550_12820 [Gemmatimonadota bacterium]